MGLIHRTEVRENTSEHRHREEVGGTRPIQTVLAPESEVSPTCPAVAVAMSFMMTVLELLGRSIASARLRGQLHVRF
jgi:hypothetical protein